MTDTIKKTALTLAGLAALGFGGAQLANATGNNTQAPAAVSQPAGGDHDGDEHAEDPAETVTGAAADKAKAAALEKVPGGKVTGLHAEHADEGGDQADTPEPGDTPDAADKPEAGDQADPAYEAKIAYDVEVTAADGTITDVHLDKAFAVLGTDNEGQEGAGE